MDKFVLHGPTQVSGSIKISGSKNAVLPILAASVMCPKVSLRRVPSLLDVTTLMSLLEHCGADISRHGDEHFVIDSQRIKCFEAEYNLVRRLRASFFILGPLLTRFGFARISLPGGCKIGARPVDLHLDALRQMGANITFKSGYVSASAVDGLIGCDITFPKSSVGATHNVIMAATLARGCTTIRHAACEPEVGALIDFLNAAGAKITGKGTTTLTIRGVECLNEVDFELIPDRIETGTYLIAAAMTGGAIELQQANAEHLQALLKCLRLSGASIDTGSDYIKLDMEGKRPKAVSFITDTYPGFPTDLQAPMMALNSVAIGDSKITETLFENRFMHVPELLRMGANIEIVGHTAYIQGVPFLQGAEVQATDLRAAAALLLAGLCAKGRTVVAKPRHIDRGYVDIEKKLQRLGVQIRREGVVEVI